MKEKKSRAKDTFFSSKKSLNCNGKILNLDKPIVMGILNLTPDSFYDGNKYPSEKFWMEQTEKMISDGASIIDIGAVSTRPGAQQISEEEEIKRLLPVLNTISKKLPGAIISIDTYRAAVAEKVINNGAHIINDISAGRFDNNMIDIIAKYNVPYVIMHILGTPRTMQDNPVYENVVNDVISFLAKQVDKLKQSGVNDVIIDPGFGFGKTLEHNYKLLNKLDLFKIFELPVLVGISRKSMINKVLGTKPEFALNGTTVLHTIALQKGADILRVHDVKEAVEAIKLTAMIDKM